MATFTGADHIKTFKAYKAALKIALNKVTTSGINFQYYEKFGFDDKERSLVLVDFATDMPAKVGKKPTASGKCKLNAADKLVFETSGTVNVDKVTRLLADAGVSKAVATPGDTATTPTEVPGGTQLDMKYGWTEMREWGDEAKELIEGFDGLVGIYRSLPPCKPEWTALAERHEDIKKKMALMVKTTIAKQKSVREAKLLEVQSLVEEVATLASDLRKQALKDAQPKPVPKSSTPQPETPKPEVSQPEPTKPKEKPELTLQDIGRFVIENKPVTKDTPQKYRIRAQRSLQGTYKAVTEDDLDKLEKLAEKRWFAESDTTATTTTATPKPTATPTVPWQDRVLDLNGTKADLSGYDSTVQGKIEEIVLTGGRNDHGGTQLSGSNPYCLHWTVGNSVRIFGNVDNGSFTLIGTGRHTGKGSSKYTVQLLLGGTCTATTA